jgi:WD40 repeat protein
MVKLWDNDNGERLRTLSGHASRAAAMAWSPNGETEDERSDQGAGWDPPRIKPKPIRYAWNNFENKGIWFGGLRLPAAATKTLVYREKPPSGTEDRQQDVSRLVPHELERDFEGWF